MDVTFMLLIRDETGTHSGMALAKDYELDFVPQIGTTVALPVGRGLDPVARDLKVKRVFIHLDPVELIDDEPVVGDPRVVLQLEPLTAKDSDDLDGKIAGLRERDWEECKDLI